jgi:hypothetical protein
MIVLPTRKPRADASTLISQAVLYGYIYNYLGVDKSFSLTLTLSRTLSTVKLHQVY